MQESFINILKNSTVRTMKTSANHRKNIVMQNGLNCQIISKKKMTTKICKTFFIFLKIFLKKVSLDVRFWKSEGNELAKKHKPLEEKKPLIC